MNMIEKLPSGDWGLDHLLAGGFHRGSAYIVQGSPGAGKTILANQFCYSHVRGGSKALYISLLAESHHRMLSYMGDMRFYDPSLVPEYLQYVSGYGVLEREGLPGLLKLVQHETVRHGASVVILDGIFVAHSHVTDAEYRKFVHELQGIVSHLGSVLLILTHQDRRPHSPEHTMVDGWLELRDELKGFRSYRSIQVRKHRGSPMLSGRHLFKISDRGLAVFPRIEALKLPQTAQSESPARMSTGIEALDRITGGGLVGASATLIMGPTGTGKTTFGLHYLTQASADAPGVMLGFYESPARLTAKAASMGLDLQGAVDSGTIDLIWYPPAENLVEELAWKLIEHVKATSAKRVFIDGISALRDNLIAPERLPLMLNALNAQLAELGASVMYTGEVRAMHFPEAMPSDEISLFVENVIALSYMHNDQELSRTASVLKLRDSSFDPRANEYFIGPGGIQFGSGPGADRDGA